MDINVRTVWSQYRQSVRDAEQPFELLPYSTLNEKLGILSSAGPISKKYPSLKYFAIGNGGHSFEMGTENTPVPLYYQHSATDACLFNQLPFVIRPISNDLSPVERDKYALREEKLVKGVMSAIYWLRKISLENIRPVIEYRNINSEVVTTSEFKTTAANLEPTRKVPTNNGVNVTSGDYVTVRSAIPVTMTPEDMAEFLNAVELLKGDRRLGIISELAVCSGYDYPVTVQGAAGNYTFVDASCVQVMNFVTTMHLPMYNNSRLDKRLDIGSNNPLFNIK